MNYICYIDRSEDRVPIMDVVNAASLDDAATIARTLMAQRPKSTCARIFFKGEQVSKVLPFFPED